jgi:hypothetical protein
MSKAKDKQDESDGGTRTAINRKKAQAKQWLPQIRRSASIEDISYYTVYPIIK